MKENLYSKIDKVVVNVGLGRLSATANYDKALTEVTKDLTAITGQKPQPRSAKASIAGFKLREGTVIGLRVTLRGKRMVGFIQKLANVTFPRIRDFRGIRLTGIDSSGNLSIGLKEHYVFPEISMEHSPVSFGVEVTIVPKHLKNREEATGLYRQLGIPFEKQETGKNKR